MYWYYFQNVFNFNFRLQIQLKQSNVRDLRVMLGAKLNFISILKREREGKDHKNFLNEKTI